MAQSVWRLQGAVGPAIRQGLVTAIPVGLGVFVEIEFDLPASGALATGALLAGFVAFDAPPRSRAVWQLLTAPVIGLAAALGALTGDIGWLAALTMTVFASLFATTVAVSMRLYIAALNCILALLLAQGLGVRMDQAPIALLLGAAGALTQVLVAEIAAIGTPPTERLHPLAGARSALRTIGASLSLRTESFRHALRFGVALGVGVATYHVLDLGEHGYWVPLTTLFVLKPEPGLTKERILMRAAGSALGLGLATPLAMAIGGLPVLEAGVMTIAAALSFAMLAIEYAFFTAAISAFVVLLAHAMGQSAWHVADERALGTLIGIAIAVLAFLLWSNRRLEEMPPPVR